MRISDLRLDYSAGHGNLTQDYVHVQSATANAHRVNPPGVGHSIPG